VLRRVQARREDTGELLVFVTNLLELSPATIAAIYKDRWQIDLFFKALKQNLKIKTFVGTSAKAVKTQIWTALICMLLLRWLQLRSRFSWSLANLVAPAAHESVHAPRSCGLARRALRRAARPRRVTSGRPRVRVMLDSTDSTRGARTSKAPPARPKPASDHGLTVGPQPSWTAVPASNAQNQAPAHRQVIDL
jgi:hypothetical protein